MLYRTNAGLGDFGIDVDLNKYFAAVDSVAPGTAAAIVNTSEKTGMDFIQSGLQVINSLVLADAQRRLLRIQLERAQQGLEPLDTSNYGLGANVSVGVQSDTQRMLWIGGAAVLAYLVFAQMRKGR